MIIERLEPGDLLNSLSCTLDRIASELTVATYCGQIPGSVRLSASYADDELCTLEMELVLKRSAKARMQRLRGMCTNAGLAEPVLINGNDEFALATSPNS